MLKLTTFFSQIFDASKNDLWLWLPVFFGVGAVFSIIFEVGFLEQLSLFIILFFTAIVGYIRNRNSSRFLIFIAVVIFLSGSFYALIFPKIFFSHTPITGKVFVDGVGKIAAIRSFNKSKTFGVVIANPTLFKAEFERRKSRKKAKKFKFIRDFINIDGYQAIDRKFLDYSKNYQKVAWVKIDDKKQFPNPPQKILILARKIPDLAVNDVISLRMLLQPSKHREFPGDFDFALDAKYKKIGAFAFAIGDIEVLSRDKVSNLNQWFGHLREVVRSKISDNLAGDSAAMVMALLIGDKSQISLDLITKIRHSGLAHLLSISGFHLSLAAAIAFIFVRFLLSRSQYLALHFDLKNIATIFAVFGAYFYLKITNSALPAQRAFLMILLAATALLIGKKINAKRAVMTGMMVLILANPYAIFNISFQLSFAAILVLGCFYDKKEPIEDYSNYSRFFRYFFEIILLSILIQIATAPLLMRAFQNISILGFVANIVAIPLATFFIMPLGFLALFLMPINLEKYALLAMNQGILLMEKLVFWVTNFHYSYLISPQLSNLGLILAVIGLFISCLFKTSLRFVGIGLFLLSFLTIFLEQKPTILFDSKQKFFALYDQKHGLFFSKKLRTSKKRQLWMNKMEEKEFRTFADIPKNISKDSILQQVTCDEKSCLIDDKKKILILLKRHKLNEICHNNFDIIVNITAKYKLPNCIAKDKIKIDNFDFINKGGHFLGRGGEVKTAF